MSNNQSLDPIFRIAALVSALLFSGAMILAYQANRSESLPRKIVVRSSYNQIEMRLQTLANERDLYLACMNDGTCGVKIAVFEEAVRQVKIVEPVGFRVDSATSMLKGTLRYSGSDIKIQSREILIPLPKDVLSSTRVGCPSETPLLSGVDADGRVVCKPIAKSTCADGEYVTAIDPATLSVSCAPIGKEIACTNGEILGSFTWQGEGRVSYTCKPRVNPFVSWKFIPVIQAGSALSDGEGR